MLANLMLAWSQYPPPPTKLESSSFGMSDLGIIVYQCYAYHRHSGSFPRRTLLPQTRLLFGKEAELILCILLADASFLGSMVALAAAPSAVSLPRMVPSRGKPAHLHPHKTLIRG